MEPVTHFLTGACLGRSGFNRRTAYATLAMTLAAEAPDMDILWGLRGPVAGFEHHRGITHTFLGAPFVALAVTAVVWLWHRSRRGPPVVPPRWALMWLLSCLAVLSHIFLDWTNNYGVRPFFPFNPRWYSLDIAFIIEPVIFAALLLGLVIPAILRPGRPGDRRRQALVPWPRLGDCRAGAGWDRLRGARGGASSGAALDSQYAIRRSADAARCRRALSRESFPLVRRGRNRRLLPDGLGQHLERNGRHQRPGRRHFQAAGYPRG